MNNLIKCTIILLIFMSSNLTNGQNTVEIPERSPLATVEQKVGYTDFIIKYSRPSKKGRKIFGSLVPYDVRWRTGANARTVLSSSTGFVIGKDSIPAGEYGIFTIPHKENWDVIIYSDPLRNGQAWDDAKIVSKTNHKVKSLKDTIETFRMEFTNFADPNNTELIFAWENTSVSVSVSLPTEQIALDKINNFLNPHEVNYRTIIVYYLKNDLNLKETISLSNKVFEMNQGTLDAFWAFHFKALAYEKLNEFKERDFAIESGIKYINELDDVSKETKEYCVRIMKDNILT